MKRCINCEVSSRKREFIGDYCVDCYTPPADTSLVNTDLKVGEVVAYKGRWVKCDCGNPINKANSAGKCETCLERVIRENRVIKQPNKVYIKK